MLSVGEENAVRSVTRVVAAGVGAVLGTEDVPVVVVSVTPVEPDTVGEGETELVGEGETEVVGEGEIDVVGEEQATRRTPSAATAAARLAKVLTSSR